MKNTYIATFLFLILHQIDAAYWHEWDMFLLPGGIQGFLLFNFIAFPILLFGLVSVSTSAKNHTNFAYLCGFFGILTFLIHSIFFILGYKQFHLPLSILTIIGCFLSGLWLIIATYKYKQAA